MKKPDTFWNIINTIPRHELAKFVNTYTNLSQVVVVEGQSGLGRQATNNDKISGLLSYNSHGLPAGFGSTAVQFITSLSQAETLGILPTGNYIYEHYQLSEFFRLNPNGWIYVGIYAIGTGTFVEISTMVQAAGGAIRQLGVFAWGHAFASADITTIQAVWAAIPVGYQQFSIIFAPDFSAIAAITGWGTIANLRLLTAQKVSVIIAQDGGGLGASLYTSGLKSVQALGAALGAISSAKVSQSIGCPALFPLSNGIELATLSLANGDLISAAGYNTLDALLGNGYLIARQYLPDISGSFFENCPTSIAATNDFAWIETNRTADKYIRGVRTAIIPYLNLQMGLNANGTLSNDTIGFFTDLAQSVGDQMVANSELSNSKPLIDPNQNVQSTKNLTITCELQVNPSASKYTVNIDLVAAI